MFYVVSEKVILLLFVLATAVVCNPVPPEDDDDIPVYTEKVVPAKPTQPGRTRPVTRIPKFGTKKLIPGSAITGEKLSSNNKLPYVIPKQATSAPKALLKTTEAIRSSNRPVRRTPKYLSNSLANGESPAPKRALTGGHNAPRPVYAPAPELGVQYASEISPSSYGLAHDYQPRKLVPKSNPDYGSALGNAPEIRYAAAPEKFIPSAPASKEIHDNAYNSNSYDDKPQPYIFGYELKDENGATQSRKEQGDDYGNKRGSYGYTDGYGIYRQVDYIADAHGFRAIVKTNEPGTENQDPADVKMLSEAGKY
ncbi:uncharacterized protein LOC118192281 isoform X1 [Stegodyphus dumicola]|uniref:uncharacterized protein LOC118192281 isoform X1 n=1 Tax=Stegodyphus dumicola TaxID=202533 RepID=UPI0015B2CF99|nr:uncharacterized protein LOC118192281 isoform X1 [Stegodyphus dumicola]